ncbi:hypothetical protein N7452_007669 [Penicillium brevicompactum]|uniref:Zn(2)-C6 fungal-type domain-containing protein n=1 Tax=Penicillium brevicompactum TaxID=5074 RepID=A0A9W9QI86_PENBR|nr:hypothetical protein N7452_007669 [Penicillium brevicompactum]
MQDLSARRSLRSGRSACSIDLDLLHQPAFDWTPYPIYAASHQPPLHNAMVGTGGRSKGCRTCRRRKVKCDEGRPLCQRCHKAGFECDGYVEFLHFIDETSRLKKKAAQRSSLPNSGFTSLDTSKPGSYQVPDFNKINFNFPLTVNPAWNENDILNTYLFRGIFDWNEDPGSPPALVWDSVLLRQDQQPELSNASVRALSMVYFAKINKQYQFMLRGAKLYTQALGILQIKLQCPEQAVGDDVLIAIILLATYELICLTHPEAWLSHYKGLAKLQPSWKTIPWAKRGLESKTSSDLLDDILCDIPGILEDLSTALSQHPNVPGNTEFTTWYIPRVLSTLEAIYSWRWTWELEFPNSTFITTPVHSDSIQCLPPSPFKSIIWFSNPHRATELILYNAMRLILTRSLEIAGLRQDTNQQQDVNDPLLPMEGNRHEIATEICRMADYHLSCFRRNSGAFMLVFPLNVAYLHLDPSATEIRSWLQSVMAVIADSHGLEIGRFENTPRKIADVHGGLQ